MVFNSAQFLLFFPIVLLVYFSVPRKIKNIWLLIASYYFYMCWNAKYALLLLFSTMVTYISGFLLELIKNKEWETCKIEKAKKCCVAGSFIINLSVLFFFKYFDFVIDNINQLLRLVNIELNNTSFDIILPVGISFYTFQALSYTVDVYRGEIYAEKNFFKYALFVSFFPQLVAGPIERSKNLLKQLAEPQKFNFEKAREGLLLMLWGYFLKIVIADRIAVFVDAVYDDFEKYGGYYLIIATILFAIQIYGDFAGYSTIAMGASKFLGIELMENFHAPYMSRSVSEFWRRWHISLSSWFRDYLYIPLGGNRKGNVRRYMNLFVVFLISGLWHGANWTFVVWGVLNGLYQIIGEIIKPIRQKAIQLLRLNTDAFSHKLLQTVITFILIDFSWIFFRANTIEESIQILESIFKASNPWVLFDGSLYKLGLVEKEFGLMLFCIAILLVADFCKYNGIKIRDKLMKQDYWFRWLAITVATVFILLFGIWGPGYDAASFIYFQF